MQSMHQQSQRKLLNGSSCMENMPKKCSLSRQVAAYGMQGGQHLHTVIMSHVHTVLLLAQWPARQLHLLFISVSEAACRNVTM